MNTNNQIDNLIKTTVDNATTPNNCRIEHHATLFALLSKAIIKAKGEEGREDIVKAITQYAAERGQRMAASALANGEALDLVSSIAYGEWVADPNEIDVRVEQTTPSYITQTLLCPWVTAWNKHNLMEYGKYYCLTVDDAIYSGFNPDFKCTVYSTISWGDDKCRFDWNQPLSDEESQRLAAKKAALGMTVKRDFNFHAAHLLHTVSGYLSDKYPADGAVIIGRALTEFADLFGGEYLLALIGAYDK